MLRKELKKLSQMICDKEKEVEKLKKENFNLLNRCRNNLKV
jgi:cell division protein FtsB